MDAFQSGRRRWPRSESAITRVPAAERPHDQIAVREVMSPNLVKVGPHVEARRASDLAAACRVEHLVVTEGGDLKGVLCTCDLWDASQAAVSSIMSSPPVTIGQDATVAAAATLMRTSGVGFLPVVDEHAHAVGVLTRGDLGRLGALDLGGQTCASCGSHHHVRHLAGYDEAFCAMCLDSTSPAVPYAELGWGD